MSYRKTSILLWAITIVFTIATIFYQRATGPTYPKKGAVEIDGTKIKYKLLTSYGGYDDCQIKIRAADAGVTGTIRYKRFKTDDEFTVTKLIRDQEELIGTLPLQPPAGKLAYIVELQKENETFLLSNEPVVIRFKGPVPLYILAPHVILMFFAMLLSLRTGLEALVRGPNTYKLALVTIIALFIGGLILGPVIQNLAFGDLWTGWPFGGDLTDNKTLVAFVFWVIAVIRLYKHPEHRTWVIIAAIVTIAIYMIPHSVLGSEFDYASGEVTTGK